MNFINNIQTNPNMLSVEFIVRMGDDVIDDKCHGIHSFECSSMHLTFNLILVQF